MTRVMVSIEEALEEILSHVQPLAAKKASIREARGLFLAEAVCSAISIPPFDRSMMDGYAVQSADIQDASPEKPVVLQVLERVGAGQVAICTVGQGQAIRIMTGAMIPEGADAVVMLEMTDAQKRPDAPEVGVKLPVQAGEAISRRGEDIPEGGIVLQKGIRLGAAELALLATVGQSNIDVLRRPRIGILTGGHELVPTGESLPLGKIYESNSHMMVALIEEWGGEPVFMGRVEDDPEAIRTAIERTLTDVDALITTGGVSVGDFDLMKAAYQEAGGEIHFWKIAMRPGTPMTFATIGGKAVFGLSGNPAAAIINAILFVAPAVRALAGSAAPHIPPVHTVLGAEISSKPIRLDRLLRATVSVEGGRLIANPLPTGQKAGILSSLTGIQGWIRVRGGTTPKVGDLVEVYLTDLPLSGIVPELPKIADLDTLDGKGDSGLYKTDTPALAIVGYKNTGKTTLVCRLVEELSKRGYRVGTIKHDHNDFTWDYPNTDTHAHRQAGAVRTAIASPHKWGMLAWNEARLDKLLSDFDDVDLVLVEGYKASSLPKIVLSGDGTIFQEQQLPHVIAVAVESDFDRRQLSGVVTDDCPMYDRNDINEITDFVIRKIFNATCKK